MGFENIGLSIFFYPFIDLNVGPTLVIRSPIYYGVEASPSADQVILNVIIDENQMIN